MDDRWTIRRVAEDARAMVDEVHGMTGVPYGRLVSEAIRVWFELLDQQNPQIPTSRFAARGD
jgi:hypothetical protein